MAQNIDQIYTVNPSTTVGANDLFYLGISPYGPTDDSAIKWSNLVVSIAAEVAGGSTTEIQYNNAGALDGDTGFTTDGAGTLSAVALALTNALPVTSGGTGLSSTTANQLLYSSATSTVAGLATANNGLLVTSAAGVPSIGNDILADITVNGITVGKGLGSLSQNTVVGEVALDAITTGNYNTAMGYNSLSAETTGTFNTAYGRYSCSAQNGKTQNTGIGMFALYNANGSHNTAVGSQAAAGALTASDNVAVGAYALSAATSGGENIVIGKNAMLSATAPGSYNIVIGSGAVASASFTGAYNVIMGRTSLGAGTSTDSNCIIGFDAMDSVTTGDETVAIGMNVGGITATGDVGVTTGGHNTLLGTSSGANDAACDGAIALGHSAVTTAATGATSGDDGPGLAIGSVEYPVGFRGDATIYPTAGTISGYMIQKINGVQYKVALYALS